MSTPVDRSDRIDSLPSDVLLTLLRGLEEEERVLSRRRRTLHQRIDAMPVQHDDAPRFDDDLLGALEYEERRLSERRLQLHQRIGELRIERGHRLRGVRAHLRSVK